MAEKLENSGFLTMRPILNISAHKFGRLTANYPTEQRKRGSVVWMLTAQGRRVEDILQEMTDNALPVNDGYEKLVAVYRQFPKAEEWKRRSFKELYEATLDTKKEPKKINPTPTTEVDRLRHVIKERDRTIAELKGRLHDVEIELRQAKDRIKKIEKLVTA